MERHQTDGVVYYTFPSLDACGEVVNAVTTRHGGVSTGHYASLNLSKGLGDDPDAVDQNLGRVCQALGLRSEDVVSPNQRHTANVCRVGRADRGHIMPGYDALITNEPGVPLVLRFADCSPVLLYDPVHRAIALVHSGWRGTIQGISIVAIEMLGREYGSKPADLMAAIGPSIGPCCYEVGDEVVAAVQSTFDRPDELLLPGRSNGRRHFDLWAANRRWLEQAGVRQIEVGGLCTACHTSEFYSHRAEAGHTGHFGAVLSLK